MKNKVGWSRKQELLSPWNFRQREHRDPSRSSGREAGARPARLRGAASQSPPRLPGLCSALSPQGSALAPQPRGHAPSYPAKRRPARVDFPVTAAAQTSVSRAGTNFLPPGPWAGSWQLVSPTGPLAALVGRDFSAPLQPLQSPAQRSPCILSNKAGARRRPCQRTGRAAGASEP